MKRIRRRGGAARTAPASPRHEPADREGPLEARLRRLEDERDILATLYTYGHTIDYGREDEWVDCFTDDGLFELHYPRSGEPGRPAPGPDRVFHGRSELEGFIAAHTRAPGRYHKHLLIEPAVRVDGETATVDSYFLRVDDERGERVIYAFGRYRDELLRCADGRWRFTRRIAEIESPARP